MTRSWRVGKKRRRFAELGVKSLAYEGEQHRQQDQSMSSTEDDQRHIHSEVVHLKYLGLCKRQHRHACALHVCFSKMPITSALIFRLP